MSVRPEDVSGVGGSRESLPIQAEKLPRLYALLIVILGLGFLFGLVAWFILVLDGKEMPEGMAVIIGTVAGGLVGVITKPGSK
jgi:hypothetical protein